MKVLVKIKNGLSVSVLVDVPVDSQSFPLVLLLHGNTGWKEEKHIESLARDLAESGIAAIRFDAPGSGDSEGTWEEDYRATKYIEATKDVLDWALENLNVDKTKVGLWGHSMGGMVAVQVAAKWPEHFAALCGSQPSTGKAPKSDNRKRDGGVEVQTEIFGKVWLPQEFFLDRLQYNTSETVKRISIPQLYIAGTSDTLVTQKAVEEIYRAANNPKQLEIYETDHFYKNNPLVLKQINRQCVKFFTEALQS